MPIVTKRKAQRKQGARPAAGMVAIAAVAVCAGLWAVSRLHSPPPAGNAAEPPQAGGHRAGAPEAGRDAAVPRAESEARAPVAQDSSPATRDPSPAPSAGQGAADNGKSASGKASKADAGPVAQPPAESVAEGKFDNDVENMLESVSRFGFESIEPLRVNMSKEEIVAILKRPVDIYEDDPPDVVADKERTADMKSAALEFIEAGGTFNQFLRDMQAQATEEREAVRDVREEMVRILRGEGEAAARAYLDKANPELAAQGLPEVHIGKGLLRMIEREAARRAAAGDE